MTISSFHYYLPCKLFGFFAFWCQVARKRFWLLQKVRKMILMTFFGVSSCLVRKPPGRKDFGSKKCFLVQAVDLLSFILCLTESQKVSVAQNMIRESWVARKPESVQMYQKARKRFAMCMCQKATVCQKVFQKARELKARMLVASQKARKHNLF